MIFVKPFGVHDIIGGKFFAVEQFKQREPKLFRVGPAVGGKFQQPLGKFASTFVIYRGGLPQQTLRRIEWRHQDGDIVVAALQVAHAARRGVIDGLAHDLRHRRRASLGFSGRGIARRISGVCQFRQFEMNFRCGKFIWRHCQAGSRQPRRGNRGRVRC